MTTPGRVRRCPFAPSRRPAHPRQPLRPDEPGEHGDASPDLGEGGGVLDVLAGTLVRLGGRHD